MLDHVTNETPPRGILGWAQQNQTPDPVVEKNYHPVHIRKAENGFIVKIGCKTFVCLTWTETQSKLDDYWKNPNDAQRKYCNRE